MLSIIIPTLNEEKLLPGLLEQLHQSTLRDSFEYEVIVSDGGSSDRTLEVCKDFNVKICREPYHKSNNIASGRNYGASFANGDVLLFINADIRFHEPEKLFHFILHEFKQSESIAMTCFVEVFPEVRRVSDIIFHFMYNNYFVLINKLGIGMGRGECQVIKRAVFESLSGYRVHLAAGEDFDLFRRAAHQGKILFMRKFKVFESPRRYRKYGYFNVALSWTLNAFSILRSDKSNSDYWEQVR